LEIYLTGAQTLRDLRAELVDLLIEQVDLFQV